ncbi:MAG: DNA replication and repair protein RecF [Muribaculaceae bacterium]|nr:DNA replication and repair protein RecF [Muribaculaceae bacterium]
MELCKLTLANFKNIAEASLEFSPKINCFLGDNGMGKSNLLDAIYYLSFTKSFTGMTDAMVIRRGEEFATARASYLRRGEPLDITLGLVPGRRKSLRRGGKEYRRLSEHIGTIPLVMAAPQDIDLIRGSGEERRRWMDMVISQSDARYLDALLRYNTALEQRNRLLRDHCVDAALYAAVEMQMDLTAGYIHSRRRRWTASVASLISSRYAEIAGPGAESPGIAYQSALSDTSDGSLIPLLDSARRHDEAVRHTTVGPHRDDLILTLDAMPMKRAASQGQCKTLATALRMAQYEFLHRATGLRPLLLLDDIFDKLDAGRVERIMRLVTRPEFGQIFITDTNRRHLDDIVALTSGSFKFWTVTDGTFHEAN